MAVELSYLLITPYTISKSRTGGVIARLLSRTDLDLVAARVITPTSEFAESYAELIRDSLISEDPDAGQLLYDYIIQNFPPHNDARKRAMVLLFRGENACEKIFEVAGHLKSGVQTGETIRDTYADYVVDRDGSARYFEPAVLTAPTPELSYAKLKLFADFADSQSNLIDGPLSEDQRDEEIERTLVIIKPDNWRYPSSRPGNIIDMLSRSGLRVIGCKVYRMSINEALEFYGPVKDALRGKLSSVIGKRSREILEKELNIILDDKDEASLGQIVGINFADDQFSQLIKFMSGERPEYCPEDEWDAPGRVKCMALIYQGKNAVSKIRDILGPTDPTKAPGGTIRREFGTNVMVNTAHASDSTENAAREMRVIKIDNNDFSAKIREYLNEVKE